MHGESQEGVNYRFCRVTELSLKFQSQSNSGEGGLGERGELGEGGLARYRRGKRILCVYAQNGSLEVCKSNIVA